MKRLLAPMSRIAEWEPPIPRQHLYAIVMLAGFSVASVTLLPSPDELLINNPVAVQPDDLSANANTLACGSLLVMTGATAGNLQIRFASEVAGSNAVVKAGSHLVATKVA